MKQQLLLVLALVVLLSAGAFATDTRVVTMGDNNLVLLDEANIFLFPSRVLEYPNLAVGEFSGDDFNEFGIHWKFGEENPWVMATYFSTRPEGVPVDFLGNPLGNLTELGDEHKRVDLFYGRKMGDYKFGFHFGYSRTKYEEVDQTILLTIEEKQYFYDFGFGLTQMDGNWDLAVDIGFGGWTDQNGGGEEETEPWKFVQFSGLFRHFRDMGPDWTLIEHIGTFIGYRGETDHVIGDGVPATTADYEARQKLLDLELGLGANWTPSSKVLAVADFGLMYQSLKIDQDFSAAYTGGAAAENEVTRSGWSEFWKIGIDAEVFKWLDVRMGATSDWISVKDETGSIMQLTTLTTQKSQYANNETYLGFGFHWGDFHLDTYTDPDLFLRGFDFINGKSTNSDMNFRISAVYEMK